MEEVKEVEAETSDVDITITSSDSEYDDIEEAKSLWSSFKFLNERLDYKREIPDGSDVFCQGSVDFKAAVKAVCLEKERIRLHFDQ